MDDTSFCFKALESTREGLVISQLSESENPICYVNPAFSELTGYLSEECIGKDCKFLQGEDTDQSEIKKIGNALKQGLPVRAKIKNYKKNGDYFWNDVSISPIRNESGRITHFVGIQKDITHTVVMQKQLDSLNNQLLDANRRLQNDLTIDHLTGLYNRKVIEYEFKRLIKKAITEKQLLTFFFMDIDNFKQINDSYGHSAGDLCLRHVSGHLQNFFEFENSLVVRYGGEEFVVISFGYTQDNILKKANTLLEKFRSTTVKLEDANATLNITLSLGIYQTKPDHKIDIQNAISLADGAMYQAKKQGKDQVVMTEDSV